VRSGGTPNRVALDNGGVPWQIVVQQSKTMEQPQITAYLKTQCGWSRGVRAVLAKYNLEYTEKDIIVNPAFRWEMEQKSGQPLSPCVEINGVMLPDISGDEVEEYLVSNNLVQLNAVAAGVPTNAPCTDDQHAAMGAGLPVDFRR
jgi:glutaredoxin-related protein